METSKCAHSARTRRSEGRYARDVEKRKVTIER